MPTLIRLVVWIAVLAGIAYGSMLALVTLVHNEPTEISERVRLDDLKIE
ncbi:MAG: histidine kinase [Tepidamorphaceae bacterium]|nr:histidine kinase [Rhodobiaceae bacterium]